MQMVLILGDKLCIVMCVNQKYEQYELHQLAASVTCWITMTRSSSIPNHNGNLTSRSLSLFVFDRSPEIRPNFLPIGDS